MSLNWDHVDRLLDQALDLPSHERQAFIQEAASGDQALENRLKDLVQAAERPEDGFADITRTVGASLAKALRDTLPSSIGPFQVSKLIGRGGMGAVYKGTRETVTGAETVALKVIRPELLPLASVDALLRFKQERVLLSQLQHPHIARLVESGETEEGIPYLAMEYVDGQCITDYCENAGLSLRARLKLFQAVANAVAYAHRQLVVHRDLKPSNILVSQREDGSIAPTLIDFGIAKLIDPPAGTNAPVTVTRLRPLTPEYAAPEQLRSGEVSTATDVYALGTILYEMLTGARPFQTDTREELERQVVSTPPKPPSSQVSLKSTDRGRGVALQRLRGDLDRICLKALRKEPERRYTSASEFADDIENYLQGRPVRARPATFRYRASKFSQRNRIALSAGAIVLLALIGGLGVSLWQTRIATLEHYKATVEAQRAEQATEFMAGLLSLGNPRDTGPVLTSPAALADSGLAYLLRDTTMDPLLRVDLLVSLSQVLEGQGQLAKVVAARELAVELLGDIREDPDRHAHALFGYAEALESSGRYRESLDASRKAMHVLRQPYSNPVLFAEASARYGVSLSTLGRSDSATTALHDAVEALESVRDVDPRVLMNTLDHYARVLDEAGRNEEAVVVGARAVAISRQLLGSESVDAQIIPHNYAIRLSNAGRLEEAGAMFEEVLRVETKVLGVEHAERAITALNVAKVALRSGQLNKAVAHSSQGVRILEREGGPGYLPVVNGRLIHAAALSRLGRHAEAEAIFQRLLALDSSVLADESRAEVEFLFGMLLQKTGRPDEGLRRMNHARPNLTPTEQRDMVSMFGR